MRRLTVLHKLATSVLAHHILVVRLHEVRDAAASPLVQHLLAVLTVLRHHLVVLLLLLLQLIVESVELCALAARTRRKHRVDVLTKRNLGTEPIIHLVVVAAAWNSHSVHVALHLLAACCGELVEVGSLVNVSDVLVQDASIVSD